MAMLPIYLICAIVGGGLALLSVFGGGDDADAHGDSEAHADALLPFFSLRFWTWFAGAFGLTGLLLTLLAPVAAPVAVALSLGTGLASGLGMAWAVRRLRADAHVAPLQLQDLSGAVGRVTVAVRPGRPGKVRFVARGEAVEVLAVLSPTQAAALEAGTPVLVIDFEDGRATVVPADELGPGPGPEVTR